MISCRQGDRVLQIEIPFRVDYQIDGVTPIEDVIASLVAIKLLIEEGGYNLPHFIDGFHVEKIQVNVTRLSQESPLRELLLVGMFLAFQKNLETEVPAMFEKITGTHVPDEFKTILTLSVLIVIFYGAAYVKDLMAAVSANSRIKTQLNEMVEDLASRTGKPASVVRAFLDERYKPKGRIKTLSAAAFGFFKPSKSQLNAPILVNERTITTETIADVPQDYSYEEIMDGDTSQPFTSHCGIVGLLERLPSGACTHRKAPTSQGAHPDRTLEPLVEGWSSSVFCADGGDFPIDFLATTGRAYFKNNSDHRQSFELEVVNVTPI
jgi:hypothetical protein